MDTDEMQMRCGACGCDAFKITTTDESLNLIVRCVSCESSTIVSVEPARLKLDWGENSEGLLSVF